MRPLTFTPMNATESIHVWRVDAGDDTIVLHVQSTPTENGVVRVAEYGPRGGVTNPMLILPPKGISDWLRLSFWGVVGFMENLERTWPQDDGAFQHWTARAIGRTMPPGIGGVRWRIDIPITHKSVRKFTHTPPPTPRVYKHTGARVDPEEMQRLVDLGVMFGVVPAARWAWAIPNDPANRVFLGLHRFASRMDPYISVKRNEPAHKDWALIFVCAPVGIVAPVRYELEDTMRALAKKVGWTFDPLAFSRVRIAAMTKNLHVPTRRLVEIMSRVVVRVSRPADLDA